MVRSLINRGKRVLAKWKESRIIKSSGFFDPTYYLFHYSDVRKTDIDPLDHFINHGWKEGKNPSSMFNTLYYLKHNLDVEKAGINPLLHYLLWGKNEGREIASDCRDYINIIDVMGLLINGSQKLSFDWVLEDPIDILIPVYNGKQFLDPLFTSIIDNTLIPFRLLIANDKSTDPGISEFLIKFKNIHTDIDIIIVENDENLGFVKTINKLADLTKNHFVILNTDTEVPPHWLERLMYPIVKFDNIASTTPFSNSATICSFPKFLKDNPIFENLDVTGLDSFFQCVDLEKNIIEIPTGVGFCMGINKYTYQKIGMFDEVFNKGYGEENDWCMRASESGNKHLIVPNLFVYHKHGGSFPIEEKNKLLEVNTETLRNRYPDYFFKVSNFIKKDPLRNLRTILIYKITSTFHKPKLYIDHSLGGGAYHFLENHLLQEEIAFVVRFDNFLNNYYIYFYRRDLEDKFLLLSMQDIEKIIHFFDIESIIINELVSYPHIFELIKLFINIQNSYPHINLTFMVHDYYCVCPMYNLIGYETKYCGIPLDLGICEKCLKMNPLIKSQVPYFADNLSITTWRENFSSLLCRCTEIVCFSMSSKTIIKKVYPDLSDDHIKIKPHVVDWVRPVKVNKTSDVLNIAVLGHMTLHKGTHIISSLATYVDYKNLDVKIHLFGKTMEPYELFDNKCIVKHEAYKAVDLPQLMEDNEIDLVLIPSIWPETFSYTTEEAMIMDLPVAVFDIGAPAERVKQYDKGIILDEQTPAHIINKIFSFLKKENDLNKSEIDIVFVCVSNNNLIYSRSIISSAYMTEHQIIKLDNTEENVPIPIRYNNAINQLIASDYSGWIFFVHNDFSLLESVDDIVTDLPRNSIYGPIGAIWDGCKKVTLGQILQGDKDVLIPFGYPVTQPTLVDTVDCQCLFFHTDLLTEFKLSFDENKNLHFHQYTEDFCLSANIRYGIKTYVVPFKCKHLSWGKRGDDLDAALGYINQKYPNKNWAGTCTHL